MGLATDDDGLATAAVASVLNGSYHLVLLRLENW